MRRLLSSLTLAAACGGSDGPSGPDVAGEPGTPGEDGGPAHGSISAITPDHVFLLRRIDVTLSGYGTDWSEDATVSFGEGVEVEEVRRASPTALVATIHATASAPTALRDVVVTDGDEVYRSRGSFIVSSSLEWLGLVDDSRALQGSIVASVVVQRDETTPFHPRFGRAWIHDGARFNLTAHGPFFGVGFVAIDVHATPGPASFFTGTILDPTRILDVVPQAIDVEARVAQEIGGPTATLHLESYDNELIAIDAEAGELVTIRASTTDPFARHEDFLLPESGAWADLVDVDSPSLPGSVTQFYAPGDARYHYVVRPYGGIPYDLDLDVERTTVILPAPAALYFGAVSGLETDVYEVHADAGQRIRAEVGPGATDSCGPEAGAINAESKLLDGSGKQLEYGWIVEEDFCPALSTEVEATGTYYIQVSASLRTAPSYEGQWLCVPAETSPCSFDYSLTVEVE